MLKQMAIEAHELKLALESSKRQARIARTIDSARKALAKVIDPNGEFNYDIKLLHAKESAVRLAVGDMHFSVFSDGRVKFIVLNPDGTMFNSHSVESLADIGEVLCNE